MNSLQHFVDSLIDWTEMNQMTLHPDKTKFMLVTTSQKLQNLVPNLPHLTIKPDVNKEVTSLHFTYPIVYLTVGAPRMIGQPLFSILLCFRPFEGLHPTLILSTPLCCLPISFSVCLSFSLLVPCPVGSSLQVLFILFCAHTISVFVSSQW